MPKLVCSLLLLLLVGAAARADAPAAVSESGREPAAIAFDTFAARWMDRAREAERRARAQPTVQPGASAPLVTYRGCSETYDLELRTTGNLAAPYVGLLRYTEHVYGCSSVEATDCEIVSSVPVTEIFRYQEGRWHY